MPEIDVPEDDVPENINLDVQNGAGNNIRQQLVQRFT